MWISSMWHILLNLYESLSDYKYSMKDGYISTNTSLRLWILHEGWIQIYESLSDYKYSMKDGYISTNPSLRLWILHEGWIRFYESLSKIMNTPWRMDTSLRIPLEDYEYYMKDGYVSTNPFLRLKKLHEGWIHLYESFSKVITTPWRMDTSLRIPL